MTPTARTMKHLKACGVPVERVEQRLPIPGKFVTRDLFNFIDVIALEYDAVVAIQITSGSNVAARMKKISDEPLALRWLSIPNTRLEIHGWRKSGKRGERKTWKCRVLRASVLPGGESLLWNEETDSK